MLRGHAREHVLHQALKLSMRLVGDGRIDHVPAAHLVEDFAGEVVQVLPVVQNTLRDRPDV